MDLPHDRFSVNTVGKMKTRQYVLICTIILFCGMQGFPNTAVAQTDEYVSLMDVPSLNPPRVQLSEPSALETPELVPLPRSLPTTEWTFHKTPDNVHPDGYEQQMMWLMNRARANPPQEGVWLATTDIASIASPRTYFDVDVVMLQNEFDGYAAKPPAAFDVRLYNAAQAHSDDLIARDAQDHDGQFARIQDAGFSYTSGRGNVFSYSYDALNAHGGFNIDWGFGTGGMQDGRGHRMAIMSIDGDYTNVGIAMIAETNPNTQVGPLVTTGNYCKAATGTNHYNRFIVGTVWKDENGDAMYNPGEGIGGVTVMPHTGTYYAITANSGGYAIPITAAGTYDITFSGSVSGTQSVNVDAESVLLDFITSTNSCGIGDMNCDGQLNIFDLQRLINCIFGFGSCEYGDLNSDGNYNIFDLQQLINRIFE